MKILIADDDAISRRVLHSFLTKWGYDVVVANDGLEAMNAFSAPGSPRLAILDWMMPGLDGLQVCHQVRELSDGQYFYIILLTARDRSEEIVEGLYAGADDYISKPFNAEELKVRLRAGQRIIDLQKELLDAQEKLLFQATHDPLTRLWNRGAIFDMLQRETVRASRLGGYLGVILGDLDHFKNVNDTYGHPAGDSVLAEASRRMATVVRPYDSVGRYGGEEFLIVLPGSDRQATSVVANRLMTSLSSDPIDVNGVKISITGSFGVVSSDASHAVGWKSLINSADQALFKAKRNGRNRVEVADTSDMQG
jgi:two-component system cell cycle response regulator